MEKEKLESLLIDYIDGRLSPEDRVAAEQAIAQDATAKQLYEQLKTVMSAMDNTEDIEPGQRLRSSFDSMLAKEMAKAKPSRTVFFQPVVYRMAAGIVLVIAALYGGNAIIRSNQQEAELQALKKEVESTKQMMLLMLDNQQSASQRMVGATVSYTIEKADDEIVDALVKTMNEDPNTNVRLAALEGLIRFQSDPRVKKALIASLSLQKDPVVQITLIQFMVKMKEREVVKQLQHIVDDTRTIKAVKDEALTGLLKLS
jgi:hypothetical protein